MEVRKEVIDCLGEYTGPVNRVHCAKVMLRVELAVAKKCFHDVLVILI